MQSMIRNTLQRGNCHFFLHQHVLFTGLHSIESQKCLNHFCTERVLNCAKCFLQNFQLVNVLHACKHHISNFVSFESVKQMTFSNLAGWQLEVGRLIAFRCSTFIPPLPIAHSPLLIAHCSLPIAHCPLPIAHDPRPTTHDR